MITFPGCKINLGLYVTEKRTDGYHNLETCFYAVPWTDILEAVQSENYRLDVSGSDIPVGEDNLCTRAFRMMVEKYHIPPVHAHLHKCLPHGAGLGGGSSDAASMLRLLNDLNNLGLTNVQLEETASALGSDCAFFINPTPKLATGRGDIFSDVNLSLNGKFITVIKPAESIATAEAYRHVKIGPAAVPVKEVLENYHVHEWKNLLFNAFEEYAFSKIALLPEIKNMLYQKGAAFALMSGSGSAVFGIFDNEPDLTGFPDNCTLWKGQLH